LDRSGNETKYLRMASIRTYAQEYKGVFG
jgi:hypothetical protein